MEILIIFGALIGLAILANIFFWFAELIRNMKLGSQFGQDIGILSARLDAVCVEEMTREFDVLRTRTRESIGRLTGPEGRVLNVCPRCGSSMRCRRVGRGVFASCTTQGCLGSMSISTDAANLDTLTLT